MDAATATALVLFCAESSLPKKADELLAKAEELGRSADDCGIPKKDLVAAADKLSRAGEEELLEAVIDLGKAAAALGQEAAILARACDGFGRLVTAIKMVRDSEEEPQPRGFTARIAAWWSRWRKSRGDKKADLEAHLIDTDITSPHQGAPGGDVPASSAPGGDTLASVMDRMSAMHGCALFGSLSLIPYVGGPAGLLKDFTNGYRQGFCRVFSSCWGLVGLGVSCSFARSRYQRLYARLSSRFGMLGITIFVIFFCQWQLDPTGPTPWALISIATVLHTVFFIWSCREGDL